MNAASEARLGRENVTTPAGTAYPPHLFSSCPGATAASDVKPGVKRRNEMAQNQGTSNRGFASMDENKQREIAAKGGRESGGNFKNDPGRASEAGRKGGHESGGNFAHDRDRASQAGQKGGSR
jgi:general stress protein YciG